MKFLLDQRLKHRVIGAIVILSIAAVFLPAMMKQSNYSFDRSTSVSIRLPNKPAEPNIAIKDEDALFKTVKVAHVDLPTIKEPGQLADNIRAQPISDLQPTNVLAKADLLTKPAVKSVAVKAPPVAKASPAINVAKLTKPIKVAGKPTSKAVQKVIDATLKENLYGVQLASFSQVANAQSLVTRLRNKGYKASYTKSKNGNLYKVVVGGLKQRQDAVNLQKKLATNLQLNGFIVKGVG